MAASPASTRASSLLNERCVSLSPPNYPPLKLLDGLPFTTAPPLLTPIRPTPSSLLPMLLSLSNWCTRPSEGVWVTSMSSDGQAACCLRWKVHILVFLSLSVSSHTWEMNDLFRGKGLPTFFSSKKQKDRSTQGPLTYFTFYVLYSNARKNVF